MEEFIRNFHFLRPWYLLLLFLPLLFYWKYFRGIRNKSSWEAVCDKRLLDFLLIKGSSAQRKAVSYLAFAGFIGAILALSGPSWQKKEYSRKSNGPMTSMYLTARYAASS